MISSPHPHPHLQPPLLPANVTLTVAPPSPLPHHRHLQPNPHTPVTPPYILQDPCFLGGIACPNSPPHSPPTLAIPKLPPPARSLRATSTIPPALHPKRSGTIRSFRRVSHSLQPAPHPRQESPVSGFHPPSVPNLRAYLSHSWGAQSVRGFFLVGGEGGVGWRLSASLRIAPWLHLLSLRRYFLPLFFF